MHDCWDDGDEIAQIAWKVCDGYDAWMPTGSLVAVLSDDDGDEGEPQYTVQACDVE
jgi:hypothetical protein